MRRAGLSGARMTFVVGYAANGGNGTHAYRAAFPGCESDEAAAVGASRLLRIAKVRRAVEREETARWKRLQMHGDEAMGRIALDARPDVRLIFDDKNQLLPVRQWPDGIVNSVKAIRPGPFGTTVVFNDSLTARRLIAEQTGKLKNPIAGVANDLARILAGDFGPDE